MSIIKKLIEKHKIKKEQTQQLKQEKEYLKPRYILKNLYIGEIVKLTRQEHLSLSIHNYNYVPVKSFAIFYKCGDDSYLHIKSNQMVKSITYATEGEYALDCVMSFYKRFAEPLRQRHYRPHSKISKKVIDKLETEVNLKLNPNQEENDTFKL